MDFSQNFHSFNAFLKDSVTYRFFNAFLLDSEIAIIALVFFVLVPMSFFTLRKKDLFFMLLCIFTVFSFFFSFSYYYSMQPAKNITQVNETVLSLEKSKFWNETTRQTIHSYYSDGVITDIEKRKINNIKWRFNKIESDERKKKQEAEAQKEIKANILAIAEKLK